MIKKNKLFNSVFAHSVFLLLAVIAAILFRASRSNWVFIGTTVGLNAFPVILLGLMAACAALLCILLWLRLESSGVFTKKSCRSIYTVTLVLSAVLFIFALIYSLGLALSESKEVFALDLVKTLKESTLLITVPFFTLFFPRLPAKAKGIAVKALIITVLITGVNTFYPLSAYKITSEPTVIDNGKEYSIVFSTNDEGTAWAEYTYNGKSYRIYDHTGGRKNADSKIHSISVPYEHLRNNTYSVGSTRVIEQFSYGSRTGKTVTSEDYTFSYNDGAKQTWLVISDWHTMLDTAYKAIESLGSDYDAVILLGDATPGLDFEQQAISNIVQFGGEVSKGTKPVLYVRGNHETRGAYANKLPDALGLEQLYYSADIGPYSFIVLDSGEDKDDSHIEYGGMNDYNTYRADMTEWLKGVRTKNEKVIALSHSWRISDVEPELSAAGWAELDRLGTRLLLSGHEHQCRFIGDADDRERELKAKYPDIIGYIDGGKQDKDFIASMLILDEKGFEIKAADNSGNSIVHESFNW